MLFEMFFEGGISLPFLCPVTRLRSACVVLPTYCLLQMPHLARYTTHRDEHVAPGHRIDKCFAPDNNTRSSI